MFGVWSNGLGDFVHGGFAKQLGRVHQNVEPDLRFASVLALQVLQQGKRVCVVFVFSSAVLRAAQSFLGPESRP